MKLRRASRAKRFPSGAQVAFGRAAIGAMGLGALAVGATAVGAVAIGALVHDQATFLGMDRCS